MLISWGPASELGDLSSGGQGGWEKETISPPPAFPEAHTEHKHETQRLTATETAPAAFLLDHRGLH